MIPAEAAGPDMTRAKRTARTVLIIAVLALIAGAILNPVQFLRSYLWAYWFWLGIAIGSGQVLMMYQLTGGAWGYMIERIMEAATRTLPYMFVLVIPVAAGMRSLYSYTDAVKVAADKALQHKALYLNQGFVLVRLGIYFLLWWIFSRLLTRWSDEQDRTGDLKYVRWRENLSGPGIIAFGLATTFASVDWFMALEPDFYSTMYPGFWIVGQILTAFAFAIIVLRYLADHPPVSELISPPIFHDLGNLLLAFVILWAYVQVAQLIIAWSGNLPKEIVWYLDRTRGNWSYVALLLALFHFFFPFFVLLGRRNKQRGHRLAFLAVIVIMVHAIDNYWNAEPAFHPGQFYFHWLDLAAPVALGAAFVALFLWQLGKRPLLPAHDPRIEEVLEKA